LALWLQIFLEEIGIFFISVNSRKKNDQKMEKIDKIYKAQNWEKKEKKKHWYRGIYMCAL